MCWSRPSAVIACAAVSAAAVDVEALADGVFEHAVESAAIIRAAPE